MDESLVSIDGKTRCAWARGDWLQPYHDREWGVPLHEDRRLFEFILLDGFQAGLNWEIILKKRQAMRLAFDDFDPVKVAAFTAEDVERLLGNTGIIRNRQKINAAITNARAFLAIQAEFGSFDRYLWGFTDGEVIVNAWKEEAEIPARTPLSDGVSRDLIRRGFKFAGSTICYAFMQAAGIVNDHLVSCYRYRAFII